MKRLNLTGFQLKYIALVAMVLDHIHYFFDYTGKIPIWFSMIGRLAAPLFLFMVIEGFMHTRNRKHYFWRMYALAAFMGLIQFAFYNVFSPLVRADGFFPKNMMLSSFAILLVALQGIAWIQEKKYLKGIPTLIFPLVLPFLFAIVYQLSSSHPYTLFFVNLVNFTVLPTYLSIQDGATSTLILGIVMYLCNKTLKREVLGFTLASLVVNILPMILMGIPLTMPNLLTYFEWMSIFAAPLMLAYNGQRGRGRKYLFYIFYPAHIYFLYALSVFLYK